MDMFYLPIISTYYTFQYPIKNAHASKSTNHQISQISAYTPGNTSNSTSKGKLESYPIFN